MDDQTYLLIFRLLHIVCGIFWAGSVFYFALFLVPAVKASGPEGGKFMQQLGRTGYPTVILIVAIITLLSGILLIWKLSAGFQAEWFSSTYAKVLTMGGGVTIIAFVIGFTVNRPVANRINKIGSTIAESGAPPTPEQVQELATLRKKLFTATKYVAILVLIAVIAMSIFRYI